MLSTKDFNEILSKIYLNIDEVYIISYNYSPLSDKLIGFLGKHNFLKLEVKIDGVKKVLSFFVKTQTGLVNPLGYYFKNIYEKEVLMYNFLEKIRPNMTKDILPKFYHEQDSSKTIVLEDLSQKKVTMSETIILDEEHIMVVLKSLAKFHTISIIYEIEQRKKAPSYDIREELKDLFYEVIFSADETSNGYKFCKTAGVGLCSLVDLMPDGQFPQKEALKRKILDGISEMLDDMTYPSRDRFNVIAHGDLWARNVLFNYDSNRKPKSCYLVDFQFVRYAPPAHDVTMIIYQSAAKETWLNNLEKLTNYYYSCLGDELNSQGLIIEEILPVKQYKETMDIFTKYSKLIQGIYRSYTMASNEVLSSLGEDEVEFKRILFEDRTQYCRRNFENDANYRNILTGILVDCQEMYF